MSSIRSLHHVTATVAEAQPDLDCYVGALGMRLVKKTVNFDNHGVYHFYYGDERGTPGTLMTTFPYAGMGVPVGVQGAGQVTATAFSVPSGSLAEWRDRLSEAGLGVRGAAVRFGDDALTFEDPSGLVLELVANDDDPRDPWEARGVSAEHAVRGIHSVVLSVRDPDATVRFLADVLGWEVVAEEGPLTRMAVNGDRPGHRLEILHTPEAPEAVNGLGTVHHVAMAVDDDETQAEIRERLLSLGVSVTPFRDRQYFRSIYFREPNNILYEVATIPPGFAVDEPLDSLGVDLKLPPDAEPHRADIERRLVSVEY